MGGRNTLEVYEQIARLNEEQRSILLTSLEEASMGEKALAADGKLLWKSSDDSFFSDYEKEAASAEKSGIVTIGNRKVFCEVLGLKKKLVICGGGHVSMPLITMGRMLGFFVTVLEDRPGFADNARRQGASEVICDAFDQALDNLKGDGDTFFVIVTRGHRCDQLCLERIVRKKHAYIGMMGSRRRAAIVKQAVLDGGADPEIVGRVYSPIGLDIGAETPEEIAAAILAEIIQVKNRTGRNSAYSPELLQAIRESRPEDGAQVLATIISRKGSAPREVGTKMLILPDGKTVGTIGGGCMESEVIQRGVHMLRAGGKQAGICHVDMTAGEAEEEGMVCGGVIGVLLQVLRRDA